MCFFFLSNITVAVRVYFHVPFSAFLEPTCSITGLKDPSSSVCVKQEACLLIFLWFANLGSFDESSHALCGAVLLYIT